MVKAGIWRRVAGSWPGSLGCRARKTPSRIQKGEKFMSSDFGSKNTSNPAEQRNESTECSTANPLDRRHFLASAAVGAAGMALPRWARANESGLSPSLAAFQD